MDLFASAAEERLTGRAPLAARLRPRNLDEVVGPGRPARCRPAAATADRVGPAHERRALGAARHRQDEHRPPHRRRDAQGVRAAQRGQRRGQGRARGRRAGPATARRARPGHDPVPRRGPPVQSHPAGRAAPARGGGPHRPRRRDHREPVLLAHRAAAQPVDAVPARAGRRRRPAGPRRRARSPTRSVGSATSTSRSTTDALDHLVDHAEGDARHTLTSLDVAAALASEAGSDRHRARARGDRARDARAALRRRRALRHRSPAFIKSIRGSDVDAGLYWLARMIEAGEDARFIARRLVILASEDVGLADPMALPIATAAAQAVEFVGLPEAMHNLSHAVIYLANAPKSNGAKAAIGAALADVRDRPAGRRARAICGTRATRAPAPWVTARGTSILTTRPVAGPPRSTARPRWRTASTGCRAATATTATAARRVRGADDDGGSPMGVGEWLAATGAVLLAVLLGGLLFALGLAGRDRPPAAGDRRAAPGRDPRDHEPDAGRARRRRARGRPRRRVAHRGRGCRRPDRRCLAPRHPDRHQPGGEGRSRSAPAPSRPSGASAPASAAPRGGGR